MATNTQQERKKHNSSQKQQKLSALIILCVAKVSLQAENKTSFLSCHTYQLLLTQRSPSADPAKTQNPDKVKESKKPQEKKMIKSIISFLIQPKTLLLALNIDTNVK